jgi:hypothetical protein
MKEDARNEAIEDGINNGVVVAYVTVPLVALEPDWKLF